LVAPDGPFFVRCRSNHIDPCFASDMRAAAITAGTVVRSLSVALSWCRCASGNRQSAVGPPLALPDQRPATWLGGWRGTVELGRSESRALHRTMQRCRYFAELCRGGCGSAAGDAGRGPWGRPGWPAVGGRMTPRARMARGWSWSTMRPPRYRPGADDRDRTAWSGMRPPPRIAGNNVLYFPLESW